MPQLDRIIITSQIFWLFLIFLVLYTILTHFFLPKFLRILKIRKQMLDINNQEASVINVKINERRILLKQLVVNNLSLIENYLKTFTLIASNNNVQLLDMKIANAFLISSLYCNNLLFKSIILFPKTLNLKIN